MCDLTVIMPVFNEKRIELTQSINSVLNQSFSKFSFIIIDDNPKSLNLKDYLYNISLRDKRIHVIFNKKNMGPANSRNKGIYYAHSKLIALLDGDDISQKNRFKDQIYFMKKNKLDFVFPNGETFSKKILSGQKMFYKYSITNQNLLKYIFSHYTNISIHSGWMLKRNIYRKLHGYRTIKAAEDFDFLLRALVNNYRLGYQSNVLVYRRIRNNGVSHTNILNQFLSSYILQRYVRKYKYNKILPITLYNKYMNKYVTDKSLNHFRKFLYFGRKLKRDFNFIYFIKFCWYALSSINSIRCIVNLITDSIIGYRLQHVVKRNN